MDVSNQMLGTWLSGAVLGPVAMLQNVDCCYLRLRFLVPPGFWKVVSVLLSAWHTLMVVFAWMPFSIGSCPCSFLHAHLMDGTVLLKPLPFLLGDHDLP